MAGAIPLPLGDSFRDPGDLPGALFELGNAELSLGQPYQAVCRYAEALWLRPGARVLAAAERTLARLAHAELHLDGRTWLRRLLRLGRAVAGGPRGRSLLGAVRPRRFRTPILVVAGVDRDPRANVPAQRRAFAALGRALERCRGTVVAGGLRTGVSGLVGNARSVGKGTLTAVGYMPALETPGLAPLLDVRYDRLVASNGIGPSPADALMFWEQLVRGGGDPKQVRLVGFGGGPPAACAYRIALARARAWP